MNNVLFNNRVMGNGIAAARRPRVYRHRPSQLLDVFTEEEIRDMDRYRFRRNSVAFISDLVNDDLERPTQRNHALSEETQVLVSLRYLASGCFFQVVADLDGIDKSSVSRVVLYFCKSIVSKRHEFVKFPFSDNERNENKLKFFKILCIDGFHVKILLHDNKIGLIPLIDKTTRCSVERSIGQLKRRFNCLQSGFRLQPEKACIIIVTCVILHNIAKILNEEYFDGDESENFQCDPLPATVNSLEGKAVRDHTVSLYLLWLTWYRAPK